MKKYLALDSMTAEKCVKIWGAETQMDKLIEECAELIHAAIRCKGRGLLEKEHFAEEIADVIIMIQQIEHMDCELELKISKYQVQKIKRLKELIKEEEI